MRRKSSQQIYINLHINASCSSGKLYKNESSKNKTSSILGEDIRGEHSVLLFHSETRSHLHGKF